MCFILITKQQRPPTIIFDFPLYDGVFSSAIYFDAIYFNTEISHTLYCIITTST